MVNNKQNGYLQLLNTMKRLKSTVDWGNSNNAGNNNSVS